MGNKLFIIIFCVVCGGFWPACRFFKRQSGPLATVSTLAGHTDAARLRDPFGVAVDKDGAIYVSDGDTGQIWQFDEKGVGRVVAQNLNTPSGLAVDQNGALVVAETGTHTIKRINPKDGTSTIIAGQENNPGFADGDKAQFNGPIGVAIANDGTIYVADTYNDRIRAVDPQGKTRTLAGGDAPGFADGNATTARFHTPCGLALRPDGALIVADTGNHRLRLIANDGNTTTWAGTGDADTEDGPAAQALFNEPTALALAKDGALYVTETNGAAVRSVTTDPAGNVNVKTLTGQNGRGLADGPFAEARISRAAGVALTDDGALIVTDTGNRLVRVIAPEGPEIGAKLTREQALALRPKAEDFRQLAPPRWPYDPPERPREIAATFGELRGEVNKPDEGVWFHNGLDLPGAPGEIVRAMREEKILLPLAVQLFETKREYIRFPTMGYVHLRIGRDGQNKPFDDPRFLFQHDDKDKLTGARIRRGTPFKAGDPIGTLNNQFHVHLVAGPTGGEMNALAALELPGIKDTKPPFIEGVDFYDKDWQPLKSEISNLKPQSPNTKSLSGAIRIVVRAYDQMDSNAARRRLGSYRLGYQVLKPDGAPADGFAEPRMNISFETLPDDIRTGILTYAPGSKCGYTPETILGYIVTNQVRDRAAREDFWQTSALPPGEYIVRVFVEDFFGNRSTQDAKVTLAPGNAS